MVVDRLPKVCQVPDSMDHLIECAARSFAQLSDNWKHAPDIADAMVRAALRLLNCHTDTEMAMNMLFSQEETATHIMTSKMRKSVEWRGLQAYAGKCRHWYHQLSAA
jgi:hypothetical protein